MLCKFATQLRPQLSSEQARLIAIPSAIFLSFLLPFFFVPSVTERVELQEENSPTWFESTTWYSQPQERPFQVTGLGTFEKVKFERGAPDPGFLLMSENLLRTLFRSAGGDELLYASDVFIENYVEEATNVVGEIHDDVAETVGDATDALPIGDLSDVL